MTPDLASRELIHTHPTDFVRGLAKDCRDPGCRGKLGSSARGHPQTASRDVPLAPCGKVKGQLKGTSEQPRALSPALMESWGHVAAVFLEEPDNYTSKDPWGAY